MEDGIIMDTTSFPTNNYSCSNHTLGLELDISVVKLDCHILNLYSFLGLFIIILGTVGHILSVVVIGSKPSFRSQSTGVYIIALSIAGLLAIYTGLLRWTIQGFSRWNIDIRLSSKLTCFTHTILTYFTLHLISWLQATIALDRVFHIAMPIWRPHFYSRRCRWKHGLTIVCIESALALTLNCFLLVVVKFDKEEMTCQYADDNIGQVWSAMDLVSFSLLPSIIIVICNTILVVAVSRSRVHSENENEIMEKSRRSLTVMLMTVNLLFILTTVPVSITQLIDGEKLPLSANIKLDLAGTVCSLIQYLGTASTFVVYCISGSNFRDTIKGWIRRPTTGKLESRTMTSIVELS